MSVIRTKNVNEIDEDIYLRNNKKKWKRSGYLRAIHNKNIICTEKDT